MMSNKWYGSLGLFAWQPLLKQGNQLRNVFGRRFVEQLVIDLAIFVSQYIALSDEVRPRDLGL